MILLRTLAFVGIYIDVGSFVIGSGYRAIDGYTE